MLSGNDMLDVKEGGCRELVQEMAAFTPALGPFAHELSERPGHQVAERAS